MPKLILLLQGHAPPCYVRSCVPQPGSSWIEDLWAPYTFEASQLSMWPASNALGRLRELLAQGSSVMGLSWMETSL